MSEDRSAKSDRLTEGNLPPEYELHQKSAASRKKVIRDHYYTLVSEDQNAK